MQRLLHEALVVMAFVFVGQRVLQLELELVQEYHHPSERHQHLAVVVGRRGLLPHCPCVAGLRLYWG